MRIVIMLWMMMLATSVAWAAPQNAGHADAASPPNAHSDDIPHPIGPRDTTWAGAMVIVIVGLFVAAAAVGVVVRANTPDEPPTADPHHDNAAHGGH